VQYDSIKEEGAMAEAVPPGERDGVSGHPAVGSGLRPATLDRTKLTEMFGDEPPIIARLLQVFVDETRADLAGLAAACGARDAGRIVSLAHRVKGAAGSVGAEALRSEAEQLEFLGRRGELTAAGESFDRLKADFEALCTCVIGNT